MKILYLCHSERSPAHVCRSFIRMFIDHHVAVLNQLASNAPTFGRGEIQPQAFLGLGPPVKDGAGVGAGFDAPGAGWQTSGQIEPCPGLDFDEFRSQVDQMRGVQKGPAHTQLKSAT